MSESSMNNSLIITAGGVGQRMQSKIPKQFLLLKDIPVLMYSIRVFHEFDPTLEILVVLPNAWHEYWNKLCEEYKFAIKHRLVEGGEERFFSVKNAINHATGELVAIHDGVRPLVSRETIERCFQSAQINRASVPVIPVNQSVRKQLIEGNIAVDRTKYFLVQTPQIFQRKQLIAAYNQEYSPVFTDDASVVEALGVPVHMVIGNEENIKITTPQDLKFANFLLSQEEK